MGMWRKIVCDIIRSWNGKEKLFIGVWNCRFSGMSEKQWAVGSAISLQ